MKYLVKGYTREWLNCAKVHKLVLPFSPWRYTGKDNSCICYLAFFTVLVEQLPFNPWVQYVHNGSDFPVHKNYLVNVFKMWI